MVSRRRRLGKYAKVRFAEPPWSEQHPRWIHLDKDLPAHHLARQIVSAMRHLDLTPLMQSYSPGGTPAIRPDLMLRLVLIEMQQGRYRPSQWCRDAREHTPLMWAAFGIRPSRSVCYEFADRVEPFLDEWNRQSVGAARAIGLTTATRGAQDGSTVAANASRHRLLNTAQLEKRQETLRQNCDGLGERHTAPAPAWMAASRTGQREQLDRLQKAQERLKQLHAVNERQPLKRRRSPEKIVVSPSDPEAALSRDKLKVFRPLYNVQLVRDLDSQLVLGYDVFAQSGDDGTLRPMLAALRRRFGIELDTLLADSGYVTGCSIALCERQGVTLYGPWQENDYTRRTPRQTTRRQFSKDDFTWLPAENAYRCPAGRRLTPIGSERRPQSDGATNTVFRYRCLPAHCRLCPLRDECTPNPDRGRSIRRSEHEDLIDELKTRMATEEAKALYKLRRQTVELGFADLKEHRNLQRFSGRGVRRARRQLGLTVLAHNLTVLSRSPPAEPGPADPG